MKRGTLLYLPPQDDQTLDAALPQLSSAPWQRELLARRLREEFWRGWWFGVAVCLPLALWAGWLLGRLVVP